MKNKSWRTFIQVVLSVVLVLSVGCAQRVAGTASPNSEIPNGREARCNSLEIVNQTQSPYRTVMIDQDGNRCAQVVQPGETVYCPFFPDKVYQLAVRNEDDPSVRVGGEIIRTPGALEKCLAGDPDGEPRLTIRAGRDYQAKGDIDEPEKV